MDLASLCWHPCREVLLLRQASVSDLISGRVSRENGYIVISMRRYPRFVNRLLRDEYVIDMSPQQELFEDWLRIKRKTEDHDAAFRLSHYEARFQLNENGLVQLLRLALLSRRKDVYLICQCHVGQRCHREMLLLLAKKWIGVSVEGPFNRYPIFERRLARPTMKLAA